MKKQEMYIRFIVAQAKVLLPLFRLKRDIYWPMTLPVSMLHLSRYIVEDFTRQ
jgi:hypothetical protein